MDASCLLVWVSSGPVWGSVPIQGCWPLEGWWKPSFTGLIALLFLPSCSYSWPICKCNNQYNTLYNINLLFSPAQYFTTSFLYFGIPLRSDKMYGLSPLLSSAEKKPFIYSLKDTCAVQVSDLSAAVHHHLIPPAWNLMLMMFSQVCLI